MGVARIFPKKMVLALHDWRGEVTLSVDTIYAVSALDGRYAEQVEGLGAIVSEGGLIRYRLIVECAWLLYMSEMPPALFTLNDKSRDFLKDICLGKITGEHVLAVKDLEKKTNHDVKAVEYWLRDRLRITGASELALSHVHFACTSEDINNIAYALMLRDLRDQVLLPTMNQIKDALAGLAVPLTDAPMLSRTHGQTASPTTMGKELMVTIWRLSRQQKALKAQPILAKFNGAVGNYNAHIAAHPSLDWIAASKEFVGRRLGLEWNPLTTQIESHDSFVEFMTIIKHYNTILMDFSRDMWGYISLGYFAQKAVAGEVGSSTMPHKVNPIYFENAEGNLGVASSLLGHFADKLPISRWQRDLSDSTVLRATGTAIGHTLLAWKSLLKGLSRVEANPVVMLQDLREAWEVLAEPVQTVMRRHGVVDAYERLKSATRGAPIVTREMIHAAIDGSKEIPEDERLRMKAWTPESYVGLAAKLCTEYFPKN